MTDLDQKASEYAKTHYTTEDHMQGFLAGAAARQPEVDTLRQALSDLYGLLPVHMGEVPDDKYHLITNAAALIEVKS